MVIGETKLTANEIIAWKVVTRFIEIVNEGIQTDNDMFHVALSEEDSIAHAKRKFYRVKNYFDRLTLWKELISTPISSDLIGKLSSSSYSSDLYEFIRKNISLKHISESPDFTSGDVYTDACYSGCNTTCLDIFMETLSKVIENRTEYISRIVGSLDTLMLDNNNIRTSINQMKGDEDSFGSEDDSAPHV